MASYFVACQAHGTYTVHDRDRCPPRCFLVPTEYLGEFLDDRQAAIVARVRYAEVTSCGRTLQEAALTPQRP
jgi:hypothetical protein